MEMQLQQQGEDCVEALDRQSGVAMGVGDGFYNLRVGAGNELRNGCCFEGYIYGICYMYVYEYPLKSGTIIYTTYSIFILIVRER